MYWYLGTKKGENMQTYIGVDLHRQFFVAHVEDEDKNILLKGKRYDNTPENVVELATQFPQSKVVVEATRNWQWLVWAFQGAGCDIMMAHPFRTKAIAAAKIKTDSIDAAILCHLLRSGMIPSSYIASRDELAARTIIRSRQTLVHDRTLYKNRIHALLGQYNLNFSGTDVFGTAGRLWMEGLDLVPSHHEAITRYLRLLDHVDDELTSLDKLIKQKSSEDSHAKLIATVDGVGYLTAYLLSAEIGDISRFKSAKHFASYFGLVPRLSQSGNHAYYGRITKVGNPLVRFALVQTVHRLVRMDKKWREVKEKLAERVGGKKATVAIARRLATIIYSMLKDNHQYYPATSAAYG